MRVVILILLLILQFPGERKPSAIPFNIDARIDEQCVVDSTSGVFFLDETYFQRINSRLEFLWPCDIENIKYWLKLDDNKIIRKILTEDSSFMSPESLKVGDPITDAITSGECTICDYNSYGFYIKVPSGWFPVTAIGKEKWERTIGKWLQEGRHDSLLVNKGLFEGAKITLFRRSNVELEHDSLYCFRVIIR